MSLFGRRTQEDADYEERVNQKARNELNNRLTAAMDAHEKNPNPTTRAALNDIENQLRGLR